MTDNDIIKALECCTSQDGSHPCTDCPCWDDDKSDCNGLDWKDVASLVNRQKAEIDRLTLEYAGFKADVKHFADIGKMYSEVRSDAIREFAERLQRKSYITKPYAFLAPKDTKFEMVDVCDIDNLVKEMTEDKT